MTTEVFQNDDLRRYILSYLRKEPAVKCAECNCVCVWDRKVKPYFILNRSRNICNECWYVNYNGTGCKIS